MKRMPYDNTGPLTSTTTWGIISDYLCGALAGIALNPANLILLALAAEGMIGPTGAAIGLVCEGVLGALLMRAVRKDMRTHGRIVDDGPDYGAGT